MKSMTGYGRSRITDNEHEIDVEIKSVNSRFIEVKYRIPRQLSFLESRLDEILYQFVKRGKFQIDIDLKQQHAAKLKFNEESFLNYWKIYKKAADIAGVNEKNFVAEIISQYELIELQEEDSEDHKLVQKILNTFQNAIEEHQQMARQEGKSMRSFIISSIEIMNDSIKKLAKSSPQYKEDIYEKMQQNITSLLKEKLDTEIIKRIMLEAAFYLEKADVTEEIVRLKDHLKKLETKVKQNDVGIGKSLNFILQEMHREINTIGAKFNYTNVFEDIIKVKEEIEKCREIVQNVE